jgi:prolyl-tRNA synthetase
VLYDDRDERAGVKFNDADLLGMPVRVVVGERGLKNGIFELKGRRDEEAEPVPIEAVAQRVLMVISPQTGD